MNISELGKSIPLISLDVESMGVHGRPFSFGVVVMHRGIAIEERQGSLVMSDLLYTSKTSRLDDLAWVEKNVPQIQPTHATLGSLMDSFWEIYERYHAIGGVLLCEVPWPVESRFIYNACTFVPSREKSAPYPIIDVASVLIAKGIDPMQTSLRLPSEMPPHHPLNDARQSLRIFCEVMGISCDWS